MFFLILVVRHPGTSISLSLGVLLSFLLSFFCTLKKTAGASCFLILSQFTRSWLFVEFACSFQTVENSFWQTFGEKGGQVFILKFKEFIHLCQANRTFQAVTQLNGSSRWDIDTVRTNFYLHFFWTLSGYFFSMLFAQSTKRERRK